MLKVKEQKSLPLDRKILKFAGVQSSCYCSLENYSINKMQDIIKNFISLYWYLVYNVTQYYITQKNEI